MTDELRPRDVDEDVEVGEAVENIARPSGTSLVAVRVPHDLLARMNEYAQRHDLTVSDVLRSGAEQLISGTVHFRAHYVTGGTLYGALVQPAPPAIGTPARFDEQEPREGALSVSI
jgi:hypothetical protein